MQIPVFLFTGFLDAGKTTLIKHFIAEGKLCAPDKPTLLLLCETGIETYSESFLRQHHLHCAVLRTKEQYSAQHLEVLRTQYNCSAVIVELNGFWPSTYVDQELPENWKIQEKIFCANAETIDIFSANLKGQTGDKIAFSSMAFFNRVPEQADTPLLYNLVRQYGKRAKIIFQKADGVWREDDNEEIPPYSLKAEITEIPDPSFGYWLHDLEQRPTAYIGHKVRVRGVFVRMPESGPVAFGRNVTTGKVQDAEFWGLEVAPGNTEGLSGDTWRLITAEICAPCETGGEPILRVITCEPTFAPMQEIAILQ